jgi:S1-C subfamily serine protease
MKIARFLLPLFLVSAIPLRAAQPTDEEIRIALLARLEKSVVVIRASNTGLPFDETLGSGVIASSDGLVVTAAHVVDDARSLQLTLSTGTSVEGKVLYLDNALDIALIRLAQAPPADAIGVLGDSNALRKGATIYVIGNPRGLEFSIATGIVSGRHAPEHAFGEAAAAGDAEWIQTDAAMNAGVSGGPMFNSNGEVIGIAQSIVSKSGGSEGLGFGIGINSVKKLLKLDPCLYLGFSALPLSSHLAEAFNVPGGPGLLVQFVAPGSPAANGGLHEGDIELGSGRERIVLGGDIITHVDGVPVDEWSRKTYSGAVEGERHELKFRVIRAGEVIEVPIVTVHRAGW